jgi:hypothetical protein
MSKKGEVLHEMALRNEAERKRLGMSQRTYDAYVASMKPNRTAKGKKTAVGGRKTYFKNARS